jgi:hypothetical protein
VAEEPRLWRVTIQGIRCAWGLLPQPEFGFWEMVLNWIAKVWMIEEVASFQFELKMQ